VSQPSSVTLVRGARGQVFHHAGHPAASYLPKCGTRLEGTLHFEQGVDSRVVRLGGYPVCARCRGGL